MHWTAKELPSPFDTAEIPGLFFYIGDQIANIREPDLPDNWADDLRGLKLPQVQFPSGVEVDVAKSPIGPLSCLLRKMRLPFADTRERAYVRALSLVESHQYVERVGDNGLAIWLGDPVTHLLLTYDNEAGQLINIEFVDNETNQVVKGADYRA